MKYIPKKPLVRLVNKANTQGALKVNLPSVVIESLDLKLDDYVEFVRWKDVKIPKAKFYIYKDEYMGCLHIGTISDLLSLLGAAYFDFEDFDASYIVKSFDHIKDAVKYAMDSGKKFYDSKEFMDGVMNGDITDEDCYWVGPSPIIMQLMDQWTEVVNQPDNWIEIEKSNSK